MDHRLRDPPDKNDNLPDTIDPDEEKPDDEVRSVKN